jgi:hypothetical protein
MERLYATRGSHPITSSLLGTAYMETALGLLWIPAGFLLILASVAVLFLTI